MANDDGFPATCKLTSKESSAISYLHLYLEDGRHFLRVTYNNQNQSYNYEAKPACAQLLSSVIRSVNQQHDLGERWSKDRESLGKLIAGAKKDGGLVSCADDTAKASPRAKPRTPKRAADSECASRASQEQAQTTPPNSGSAQATTDQAEYLKVAKLFGSPTFWTDSKMTETLAEEDRPGAKHKNSRRRLDWDGDESSAEGLEEKRSKPEGTSARAQTLPWDARKDPAPRASPRPDYPSDSESMSGGTREMAGVGAELAGKDDSGTIVTSDVVDLDQAGGLGGVTGDGTHALALPLLCAEELYGFDLSLAARCAMWAVKEFLDRHRHKDDPGMRIVFVEDSGSPALKALRAQRTVSDKRLIVAQSSDPASIAKLGEKNLPCQFVAVESEPFFHKGARPARRRARHIYDKSGREGSPMWLGKTTSDRYTKMHGKTGDTYAVQISGTSPLREKSKCHTVLHVIVPSRNHKHKTEECYVKDDVAGAAMLKKCYSSLLDNFYQLSTRCSVLETLAQASAASTLSATSQPEANELVDDLADASSPAMSPGISQHSNAQAAAEPGPSPPPDAMPDPVRPIQSRGSCPVCSQEVTTADMRVNRDGKYFHEKCRHVIVID
jgi:hypothetical protein